MDEIISTEHTVNNKIITKPYEISTSEKTERYYFIKDNIDRNQITISSLLVSIEKLINNNAIFEDKIAEVLMMQMDNNTKIEILKDEIKSYILDTLTKEKTEISKIQKEIKDLSKQNILLEKQIEGLNKNISENQTKVNGIYNEIDSYKDVNTHLGYMLMLNSFREQKSTIGLDDLWIKNNDVSELVKSYKNEKIPKELLDNVVLLKGGAHLGKHTSVKMLGNELNRPIFMIKYDDYFNDKGLYSIFLTLSEYLKEERDAKNTNIEYIAVYKKNVEKIEIYKKEILENNNKSLNLLLDDEDGNELKYTFIENNLLEGIEGLKNMYEDRINTMEELIGQSEESCILCIDDLDKIINFSRYEKGDLLSPIRSIIRDIKEENLDIMLVMIGDNLGNNHTYLKSQIDKVITFGGIKDNYKKVFVNILSKYAKQYELKIPKKGLKMCEIEDNYKNIKFLNDVVQDLIKNILKQGGKDLSSEEINTMIDKIINQKILDNKSLYTKIGMGN